MADILAIESSNEACSVALRAGDSVIERFEHAPMKHAELLLPMVQSVLDESDRALASLDAIAFGRGPGSFTSLRIGIGVVQGLAWGAGLPVVPVSSLAAIADQALAPDDDRRVWVAMDARMNEVYWGGFQRDESGVLKQAVTERVGPAAELADRLGEGGLLAGNGFERFEELQHCVTEHGLEFQAGLWPRASAVLRLAENSLLEQPALPAEQAQPVYLRDKVAEKPKSSK